jgi:uncharacterized lipoprotein YehR (DUF1307 family)
MTKGGLHVKIVTAYKNNKIITDSRQHHFLTSELTVERNLHVLKLLFIYKINYRAPQKNTDKMEYQLL